MALVSTKDTEEGGFANLGTSHAGLGRLANVRLHEPLDVKVA